MTFETRYGAVHLCGELNSTDSNSLVAVMAPTLTGLTTARQPLEVYVARSVEQSRFVVNIDDIAEWFADHNCTWSVRHDRAGLWFGLSDEVAATEFALRWSGVY